MGYALILLLSTAYAFGQAEAAPRAQMTLCGVMVSIGATKPAMAEALSTNCNLVKVVSAEGESESWVLMDKIEKESPVGLVSFEKDRLTGASHSWVPKGEANTTIGFARALVLVMDQLLGGSHTSNVVITTQIRNEPDATVYKLYFDFPTGKTVGVLLMEYRDTSKVTVLDIQESIGN